MTSRSSTRPVNRRQRLRVRRVLPLRRPVEQAEHPLGAGHRRQRLVVLIAENLDRAEEDVGQEEEADQVAGRHLDVGRQHAVAADEQQGRDERLAVQFQERHEQPFHADGRHDVVAVPVIRSRNRPAFVSCRTKACVTRTPLIDSASVAVTRLKLSCTTR